LIQKAYRMWLQERSEAKITNLPVGFLQENSEYIAKLRSGYGLLERSSLRYKLVTKELELLEYILRDLMAIRFKKISMRPYGRVDDLYQFTDDWVVIQKLFDAIGMQEQILQRVIHGEPIVNREPSKRTFTSVRVLKETPAFVGVDGEERGPYKVEDIVSMPTPNAHMLARQGYAEIITTTWEFQDKSG